MGWSAFPDLVPEHRRAEGPISENASNDLIYFKNLSDKVKLLIMITWFQIKPCLAQIKHCLIKIKNCYISQEFMIPDS